MLIDSIWYMPCMVTIDMEYSYTGTNVSLTYTHAHTSLHGGFLTWLI